MFSLNQSTAFGSPLSRGDTKALDARAAEEVEHLLSFCPAHKPTPLRALPSLAASLHVGSVHVKDESGRLGLGSFKALGGASAVLRLALSRATAQLGRDISPAELRSEDVRKAVANLVVGCATDGNHGRAVAAGARLSGCRAVIFVHGGVSKERVAAIAALGAEVRRVEGTYDDAVAEALGVCERHGWQVVSDTSWPGYERMPLRVMQGYTVLVREALAELKRSPTHVFVQAGVGGLAAAVAGHMHLVIDTEKPKIIVVEPARAACLLASHNAGAPVKLKRGEATVMAMLECYEPSLVAWRILERTATAFMTVNEETAVAAMLALAHPLGDDPPIVAGESGGAGLAGLLAVNSSAQQRSDLGLSDDARVLLINTEGATDPRIYRQLTGASPEKVLARLPAVGV